LNTSFKLDIVNIFNNYYKFRGKKYTLKDIIKMNVKNTSESICRVDNYKEFIYYEG